MDDVKPGADADAAVPALSPDAQGEDAAIVDPSPDTAAVVADADQPSDGPNDNDTDGEYGDDEAPGTDRTNRTSVTEDTAEQPADPADPETAEQPPDPEVVAAAAQPAAPVDHETAGQPSDHVETIEQPSNHVETAEQPEDPKDATIAGQASDPVDAETSEQPADPVDEKLAAETDTALDTDRTNATDRTDATNDTPRTDDDVPEMEPLAPLESRMAHITLIVLPEAFTHTVKLALGETVSALRHATGTVLGVPPDRVILSFNGALMDENNWQLMAYKIPPDEDTPIEVQLAQRKQMQGVVQQAQARQEILEQDRARRKELGDGRYSLTIPADEDAGTGPSQVIVHVVREQFRKRFLGGWRHRKTGTEYHNAEVQTEGKSAEAEAEAAVARASRVEKFHRDAQTVQLATRSVNTLREFGTQMPKRGVWIDERTDVVLRPRAYFTSEEALDVRTNATIVIQCYARGMLARKRARAMRGDLQLRRAFLEQEEQRRIDEAQSLHKRNIERRIKPSSNADFELLYAELEAWHHQERKKINEAGLDEPVRLAVLAELLAKETKLLQTIDRLKIDASHANKSKQINKLMNWMSAPKQWELSDGSVAKVHTPFTVRAKELKDLYDSMQTQLLTINERLDILLHVKWTVKEFDCNLTRDIVELIDREADLLNRGRSERSLINLRRRLSNLFLQFIETPEFNPEAARFQKVPIDLLCRPNTIPILGRSSTASIRR